MRTLSVAMATYNGARHLREQLDSLAAQTRRPDELVITDDQSSDDTATVVRAFAETAPFPVRFVANEDRLGWRGNFLKAAGLCRSDLIAFCDQDDIWYPQKLAVMEAAFDADDVLLAHHNADLVDGSGKAYGTLLPVEEAVQVIPALSRPTPWSNPLGLTIVFRRALLDFNDLWPETVDLSAPQHPAAHDQWFYQLATNLGTVVSIPDRLLGYRQHGNNAVGWAPPPRTLQTMIQEVGETPDSLARIELMLDRFCRVLAKAAARSDGGRKDALARALERNRQLLARLQGRRAVYGEASFGRRLGVLSRMVRKGDYGRRLGWTLGYRALVADMTVGLLYGPAVSRRFGPQS
ncbi:glycosyltransferase family 2 protein [Chthonobacter rhizosphaerae]|uniref:glycosyltransferase family 2 protein n=1 Tax=Chthonobacter rhizosphaerae TaxID=2735553 RepID=UPI0015EFA6D1|nr:glycosyltransferase family 2 protein [Chthonobacter rhizosphaerae]